LKSLNMSFAVLETFLSSPQISNGRGRQFCD
jgi:hypothetical protein